MRWINLIALLPVVCFSFLSCGNDNSTTIGTQPMGKAGNLLVSELTTDDSDGTMEQFSIGLNSTTNWDAASNLIQNQGVTSVVVAGKVVPLASTTTGFYFDPDTVMVGSGGVPEFFTTIDAIKADPHKFATTAPSFGKVGVWYVFAHVDKVLSPQ